MSPRAKQRQQIEVLDLFAGPGGLGEGFSSLRVGNCHPFSIALSAEMDPWAQRTLELRAFYRQFRMDAVPEDYRRHLSGELAREHLFSKHSAAAKAAIEHSQIWTLGKETRSALEQRIDALKLHADRTIVIGGPPCQAYSIAGRSRNSAKPGWRLETDARSHLYHEYLHVLDYVKPAAFVMENVRGLLSAQLDGVPLFGTIRGDLENPGRALGKRKSGRTYRLFPVVRQSDRDTLTLGVDDDLAPDDFLVRAEEYGIPQARHRVIILGIATDMLDGSLHPETLVPVKRPTTVRQAIGALPKLRSAISSGPDSHARWHKVLAAAARSAWAKGLDPEVRRIIREAVEQAGEHDRGRGGEWCPLKGKREPVLNHIARTHMESDLHRYLFAASWAQISGHSPTLTAFPDELLPDHANVHGGTFGDRFRVQGWNAPSTTVVSHISKDGHYYIHPDPSQCRSLTVREAARLQTFPDDYLFCGPRTAQYQQVGNAVPVGLARQIAGIVNAYFGC